MRISRLLPFLIAALPLCMHTDAAEYIYEYEEEKTEKAPIPEVSSLEEVARSASAKGVPILIEFSTPWCRYCEALEELVLKPLLLDDRYHERIIVRKLEVNAYSSIAGFDGRQYRTDQLSRMYGVDLYPTLVFFDAEGREISRRIVGITVLEYVAGELERAIELAYRDADTAL